MITIEDVKVKTPERFWSKIKFDELNKCWEWQASLYTKGYGSFVDMREDGRHGIQAHRFMYKNVVDSIPDGYHILHKCDNPKCVNPNHIWAGTNQDNVDDKTRKGRGNQPKGSKQWFAKLDESKVRIIKALIACGEQNKIIAMKFGVTPENISCIKCGLGWKHV